MADSIKEIITTWKISLGGSVPIKKARLEPMKDLFATLAYHGYSKSECTSNLTKSLIIAASVGPTSTGQKRSNWTAAVSHDIDIAIATQWPSELVKSDPSKIIIAKEIAERQTVLVHEESPIRYSVDPDPDLLASLPKPEVEYYDEEFGMPFRGVK